MKKHTVILLILAMGIFPISEMPMKCANKIVKNFMHKDAKLTFLAGAGCSVDPPSCLPTGRTMMNEIIKYTCAESEVKKIMKINTLRFEELVEIVHNYLDKDLKIIEYYGECEKPNIIHFFLAEMIQKGHFVITTNFDSLIERALCQLKKVSESEIVPVITKRDFKNFSDPEELYSKGKKTVYKIHGSTTNIITKEDTKDSLVATIQAIGSNRERLASFQIEPFKRSIFENISNRRSLVVLGYSGNDDFDIVPTLKTLQNLQNIIWIKHAKDDGGVIKGYEITTKKALFFHKLDKVNQLLLEIKQKNPTMSIYRIDANTRRLIEEVLEVKHKTSSDRFSVSPINWFNDKIKPPSRFYKLYIPNRIYFHSAKYKDALRCARKMLYVAEDFTDKKAVAAAEIGTLHLYTGEYDKALKQYKNALEIYKQLGNKVSTAIILNDIGSIYSKQENIDKALKWHKEALKIVEELENLKKDVIIDYNTKITYFDQWKFFKSSERDLIRGKAAILNNIGIIYIEKGNYTEALKHLEKALQIDDGFMNIDQLIGKIHHLNNIGAIYDRQGKYTEALNHYEEAIQISKHFGLGNHPVVRMAKRNKELSKMKLSQKGEI